MVLISGKAKVFGYHLSIGQKTIVREGKRLPFEVEVEAVFELALGAGADLHEVESSTIPASWKEAYDALKEIGEKPAVAMVIGGVDSGKSSFCTYLANRLVSEKLVVAVLDEDLGQSDIGSPATVAYAVLTKSTTDLFALEHENAVFVGATSPVTVTQKTIEAVRFLKKEILNDGNVDYIILNTDGWTSGDAAVAFKAQLAKAVEPNFVFCLEEVGFAVSLCGTMGDALGDFKQKRVESPNMVRERDKEHRKTLREIGFAKHMEGAKVKVYPLSQLAVEGKENYALIWQRKAEDFLVGLYDVQRRFLGIGVIRGVDYQRKALRMLTAVTQPPASVEFGKIRLDKNLREIQD